MAEEDNVTASDWQLRRDRLYRQGRYCGTDRRTGKSTSCSTVTKTFLFFLFFGLHWRLAYIYVGTTIIFAYRQNGDRISKLQLVSRISILLNSVNCSSVLRCNETDSNSAARTHKFAGNECHQMTVIRLTAQSVTRLQTEEHRWGGVGMHAPSVHNPFSSIYREVNFPAL
jgi:hypothetical protein